MSTRLTAAVAVSIAVILSACSPAGSTSGRNTETTVPHSSVETTQPATVNPGGSTVGDPLHAAVAYVASTDELMAHSPVGRREIFRKMVAPSAVDGQVTSFEAAAAQLATTLKVPVERLVWVEAPITATIVEATGASASVDVWTVSILGAPDAGSPQQVWRTVHVNLELNSGRWLVASATADAGPTPAANELAMQAGWKQFEVVASWPNVVVGVGL